MALTLTPWAVLDLEFDFPFKFILLLIVQCIKIGAGYAKR